MADVSVAGLVLVVAGALTGGLIQGAIGFGLNLVVVPLLALVVPEALPVAAVVHGLPLTLTVLRREGGTVDRRGLMWLVGGTLPGTLVGVLLVGAMTTRALQLAAGTLVLAFVAASARAPVIALTGRTQLAAGAVSGMAATSVGIGGPPIALLYQHHKGAVVRPTLAAAFLASTVLSITSLALAGEARWGQLSVGLLLGPVVLAGGVFGRVFHDVLDRGWLRHAVLLLSGVSAVVVLASALA